MKTKEFIKRVRELGFFIQVNSKAFFIRKHDDTTYAVVDEQYAYSFDTFYRNYYYLEDNDKRILFNLIIKYASTPIEERKEEKKYYLRHMYFRENTEYNFVNYSYASENWYLDNNYNCSSIKTQFTLTELPDWIHEMLEQGHLVKEEVE